MKTILIVSLAFAALLTQTGCTVAMGGAKETNNVVFVEPGAVCRVATDDKIKVFAVTDDGKQVIADKNIAGMYVLPASVYNELKENWDKTHPAPAAKPAVKTSMVDLREKLQPLQTIAEDAGNIRDEAADIMAEKGLTKEEYYGDKLP
jgi:hypothetical protein